MSFSSVKKQPIAVNATVGSATGVNFTKKLSSAAALVVSVAEAEPAADGATLTYTLSASANVEVTVLNLAGRPIAQLPAAPQEAGVQTLRWNGRNQAGSLAPDGVYLIRLTTRSDDGASTQAVVTLNLHR